MSVVVDFLAQLMRRRSAPSSSGAGSEDVGATLDMAALQESLERLDHAKAPEVNATARQSPTCVTYGADRRDVASIAMQARPEAAWVLSFDEDGYIREAALQRIVTPPISVGRFMSVALRLNDWVPEVRAEAARAATRIGPTLSPEIIAQAAPFLLRQRYAWRRWDGGAYHLDTLLARPDVIDAIVGMLCNTLAGPLGATRSLARFIELLDLADEMAQ